MRGALLRALLRVLGLAVALQCSAPAWGYAEPARAWNERLAADLAYIDAVHPARIGVYVRDMDTGVSVSYQAQESWYLASTVKTFVAIAVLRGIERGLFALDTTMLLRASDYVDGAGGTNHHPVGSPLTLRYLLEQMIVYSDNTASDMLIDLVGLHEVNAVAQAVAPGAFGRITTLADVRRTLYGFLTPQAKHLSGHDLLALRQPNADADRMLLLSRLSGTPLAQLRLPSVEAAFRAYYATGLNSGRLDAYGEMLAQLVDGALLAPRHTDYLLDLMHRTATGPLRIKAGLPRHARFAHKTGTQRRRTCDAGVITVPRAGVEAKPQRVLVVACTAGEASLDRADLALRQVGIALCHSGLLTHGVADAPLCLAPSPVLPAPPRRP